MNQGSVTAAPRARQIVTCASARCSGSAISSTLDEPFVRMVHERTDRHIDTAACGYASPSHHVTSSTGVGLSPIVLSRQTMSTFRRIERGFAIIGLAATAAAGLGCYALYSYHKVTSFSLGHLDVSLSQDSDKSLSDLGRPTGLRGRKLPKEFILHLDLDRTTITDAPSSMTYLSHQQPPLKATLFSV